MTSTTVYFWGSFDITGHVSVAIEDNYLSFHPKHEFKDNFGNWGDDIAGTPGYLVDYSFDAANHGRPTESIEINWLNTTAMNNRIYYYDQLIEQNRFNYQLNTHNCSTLAVELLCYGASREFSSVKSIPQLISSIKRQPFTHSHSRIFELTREVLEDFTVLCNRRGNMGKLTNFLVPALLFDLVTREFMWVPGDVEKFATQLAEENH